MQPTICDSRRHKTRYRRVTRCGRKHLFDLFKSQTYVPFNDCRWAAEKVALCPVLADPAGPPEGTKLMHWFWQRLGKHRRGKVLKIRVVEAGKETEIQPASKVAPGKQQSTHRSRCLKGQRCTGSRRGLWVVCQQKGLRTNAEPPTVWAIRKVALQPLLYSGLAAIELFLFLI